MHTAWRPGERRAELELEDPYEDVPVHLALPLWQWIVPGLAPRASSHPFYSTPEDRLQEIALLLRIPLAGEAEDKIRTLARHCDANPTFMLQLAEALLERYGSDGGRSRELKRLLAAANSAYTVRNDSSGLELRVAPGVKDLIREAAEAANGSAGDHLVMSWNAAYGRSPDPVKAYSEAIKAVEAAMAPRISPQNAKQTLGTMIRDVAAKPQKWTFAIGDDTSGVEAILRLMRVLWDGQTSRHGGLDATRMETPEEARAAVHLAGALVQFAVSGAFAAAR